jgi:uncharacterized repeat protein (TIGR03803 family)
MLSHAQACPVRRGVDAARVRAVVVVVALLLSVLSAGAALTARADFSTAYRFVAAQGDRISGVLEAPDGAIYATLTTGGAKNAGAIIRRSRAGAISVLHSFDGTDGAAPVGDLVRGSDGQFYGTTSAGGQFGYGTAFKISSSGRLSSLHAFSIGEGGPPRAGLLAAGDGNFYGTSAGAYDNSGGAPPVFHASSYGALFRLSPSGSVTVLHRFSGGSDGAQPLAALIQGSDGNLYGTTSELLDSVSIHPAAISWGTVFRLTLSGTLTTLYTFDGIHGGNPRGRLLEGSDGRFYGTTASVIAWGFPGHSGSVFSVSAAGSFASLHTFDGSSPDGSAPRGGLVAGGDGNFYGMTDSSFFRVTRAGALTTMHSFAGDDAPTTDVLVRALDGNFVGATHSTLFQITSSGALRTLNRLGYQAGGDPGTGLLLASDGNFYGATEAGGAFGRGTLFRYTRAGGVVVLYSFSASPFTRGLVQGSDGNLYGSTANGGASGNGSIFRLTRRGVFSTLYSFDRTHGAWPSALTLGRDGNLYGTTSQGGSHDVGTAFRIDAAGNLVTLLDFDSPATGGGMLVQGGDGNFYGTSQGAGLAPSVFRLTPGGVFSTLHSFVASEGAGPGDLASGPDGNFYGTTSSGGSGGIGTIFRVTPSGAFTTLYAFPSDASNGGYPDDQVTVAADGSVYGSTAFGGPSAGGTLFRLTPSRTLTRLHSFAALAGGGSVNPSRLVVGSDGALYGTTPSEIRIGPDSDSIFYGLAYGIGPSDAGTIFRVDAR